MKTFKDYLREEEIGSNVVPAEDVDVGEKALQSALADPKIKQQIEANTVHDADGDVDLSATFAKMVEMIPPETQMRAEWAESFKQFDEKFSHIEQDPDFIKMSPEDQAKTKQDVAEVRALFKQFLEDFVQLSNGLRSGAQQISKAAQAPNYENPLKGVKTLVPPAPVQEDAELTRWLKIAGLK